jgi:hypothetical protein
MKHLVQHWVKKCQNDVVSSCTVAKIDDAIHCRACPRAVDPRAEREAKPPAHESGARRGRQEGERRPSEGVRAIHDARNRRRRRGTRGWR